MQTQLTINIFWVSTVWMACFGTEESPLLYIKSPLDCPVDRQIPGPHSWPTDQKHREGTAFGADSPGETQAA